MVCVVLVVQNLQIARRGFEGVSTVVVVVDTLHMARRGF